MTELLEKALKAIRGLSLEARDEIARIMPRLARDREDQEPIDPSDLPDVLDGASQAERREFATEAEVEAAFRRFGR